MVPAAGAVEHARAVSTTRCPPRRPMLEVVRLPLRHTNEPRRHLNGRSTEKHQDPHRPQVAESELCIDTRMTESLTTSCGLSPQGRWSTVGDKSETAGETAEVSESAGPYPC